jgi:hypothetical protein
LSRKENSITRIKSMIFFVFLVSFFRGVLIMKH